MEHMEGDIPYPYPYPPLPLPTFTTTTTQTYLNPYLPLPTPSNLYNPLSFDETIKMRGNNPILALKLHILLHILMKSLHISFKPLQPTFI